MRLYDAVPPYGYQQHDYAPNPMYESGPAHPYNMPEVMEGNPAPSPFEVFRKPAQPDDLLAYFSGMDYPQPANSSSLAAYFQDENGELDLDKVFATTGRVSNMIKQVSPLVFRLGSFLKGITSN